MVIKNKAMIIHALMRDHQAKQLIIVAYTRGPTKFKKPITPWNS